MITDERLDCISLGIIMKKGKRLAVCNDFKGNLIQNQSGQTASCSLVIVISPHISETFRLKFAQRA